MHWAFYRDKADKWRWRAKALNGLIIGASTQGYVARCDCEVNAGLFGWGD